MCFSSADISDQIIKDGEYVSLPALKEFLPKDQDPPSFITGTRVYVAEGRSDAAAMPTTSVSDGTNLANLAEVYFLYYDVCRGRNSGFDKKDPGRWVAIRGQFQFCVQELNATSKIMYDIDKETIIRSTTNLDWNETSKNNTAAFCTKVDGEKEDFCVGESAMERLALEMSSVFNTTADFSDLNRTDIVYSAEWVPYLTEDVFADDDDTSPSCPVEQASRSGRQKRNPFETGGEDGFYRNLVKVADALSITYVTSHTLPHKAPIPSTTHGQSHLASD